MAVLGFLPAAAAAFFSAWLSTIAFTGYTAFEAFRLVVIFLVFIGLFGAAATAKN